MPQNDFQLTLFDLVSDSDGVDLSLLAEYKKLSEVEDAIRNRKNAIENTLKVYMNDKGLEETPAYANLVGVLYEETLYSLNPLIMSAALPAHVYRKISVSSVDIDKVRKVFYEEGGISLNLVHTAEESISRQVFFVKEKGKGIKRPLDKPFWKLRLGG